MRRRTIMVGGAVLTALLLVALGAQAFPTAPSGAASKPVRLPQELEHLVFVSCLPGLYRESGHTGANTGANTRADAAGGGGGVAAEQGLTFSSDGSHEPDGALSVRIESVGDWSVSVSRAGATMRSKRSAGGQARTNSIAAAVIPAAQSLYDCMAPYRFVTDDFDRPLSTAQLLELYRYDTTVLWPCLTFHGIDVGDPPAREQFTTSYPAVAADPLSTVTVTKKMLSRLGPALRECPLRPSYLG